MVSRKLSGFILTAVLFSVVAIEGLRQHWPVLSAEQLQAFIGRVLSDWSVSDITTFQSGNPLTIIDATAGTAYGQNSASSFSPEAELCPGMTSANVATSGSVTSRLTSYINPAAFCAAPLIGTATGSGSSGRGLITGPGQANFDISVAKKIPVSESKSFQLRAEFFNAFNHSQFANPGTTVSTPASFEVITATAVAPRLVQFALRYPSKSMGIGFEEKIQRSSFV